MKKLFFLLMTCMAILSCKDTDSSKQKTSSGYEFSHVKVGNKKVNPKDYVYFSLKIIGSDGKVLQDLSDENRWPVQQIPEGGKTTPPNPVIEALSIGNVNDTLSLRMPIDSIPNGRNNPALKGQEYIDYVMVIKDTKTEEDYKSDMEAKQKIREEQAAKMKARLPEIKEQMAQTLKDYKKGKLKLEEGPEGLKYIIHNPGQGETPKEGDNVSVHYYGTLTDGKMFDNSFSRGQPFTFALGKGQVIKGWDLGIALLKPGGSATLFIPYQIAYGEAGRPPSIPAKSELVFYVERQ